MKQLSDCTFDAASFRHILDRVQKSVDEMAHHSYSNLTIWVTNLDQIIEEILAKRLEEALNTWAEKLEGKFFHFNFLKFYKLYSVVERK